jgi:hypothetical protein
MHHAKLAFSQKYWEILGNLIHADKPDNFEISSDQWLDYFKDLNKKPIRHSLGTDHLTSINIATSAASQ